MEIYESLATILKARIDTCITSAKHVYYWCFIDVIQVYELYVKYTKTHTCNTHMTHLLMCSQERILISEIYCHNNFKKKIHKKKRRNLLF